MKVISFLLFFLISNFLIAQNPELAQKYFDSGAYEKAAIEYELLYKKFPYQKQYLTQLIQIYQKSGKFDLAKRIIQKNHPQKNPHLYVWLGYNFRLQKDSITAQKYFDKAIEKSLKSNYNVYQTGKALQDIYRLNDALNLYKCASEKYNNANFHLQLARIYAEKSKPQKMTEEYLKLLEIQPAYIHSVQYNLTPYLQENYSGIDEIKEIIIRKIQDNPNPQFYRLLQWIYTQQKEYRKAFFQLRSLYKKKQAELSEIYQLAKVAQKNKKTEQAQYIFKYLSQQNKNKQLKELSLLELLKIKIKNNANTPENNEEIEQNFQTYLSQNWSKKNKFLLKIQYADFLAFHKHQDKTAIEILNQLLKNTNSKRDIAQVKMKKADIFLLQELFNRALILYTQVQLDFPNNEIGYSATYKIARTSFFKGDINWAENQLKVLKTKHSDLISNDAIDLFFLIINNKEENDSTQTGLKKYARAKFEIFKKQYPKANQILDSLKQNFKGQLIYDDALWTQAQIYEKQKLYDKAIENYQYILKYTAEDLYKDDALYRMARIFEERKNDEEKAKKLYKKIIIDYPASFWFTDAQDRFRKLRGDDL